MCTHISAERRFVGLGVTESPTYLHPCDFFVCLVCVLVWDPSVLFQPSKSDRSSAKRNAIYIFHYPLPLSHLTPSFPLSLPSLSDLIFQLFSSLIPPVLALFPCYFLPCFKIDSPLLGSAYTSSVPPTFNSSLLHQLGSIQPRSCTPGLWTDYDEQTHKMTSAATTQLPTCPEPSAYVNICLLSDFFGDRVFNLESRVDFDEVVLAVFVHQEFHGASILIAHLQENNRAREQLYSCELTLFVKMEVVQTFKKEHSFILMSHENKVRIVLPSLHKYMTACNEERSFMFYLYRWWRRIFHHFPVMRS